MKRCQFMPSEARHLRSISAEVLSGGDTPGRRELLFWKTWYRGATADPSLRSG